MPPFIKRVSLALLLIVGVALCTVARADSFGRFGFLQLLDLPGMKVDRVGVIAKTPHSVPFAFVHPSKYWRAVVTSDTGQTVALDSSPHAPRKLAANLYAPGASLYFDDAPRFVIASQSAPFLTWPEGSVATGVPTPAVSWALVSFAEGGAPLLLVLPKGTVASFEVSGKPGAWNLDVHGAFKGWLRAEYPFGLREVPTPNASALGKMWLQFKPNEQFFTQTPPELKSLDITADNDGVMATWTFSGPFMVPPVVALAPLGGYHLKPRSSFERTGLATEAGPILKSSANILKIRFPCKVSAPGRAVTLAGPARSVPATVSAIDAPSIADLGLEAMRGDRDLSCAALADDAAQTYLAGADYAMEVWTRQTVPYNAENRGLDLTAAYAFLTQALSLDHARPPENPFLTSVLWRVDWVSWAPYAVFPTDSDRRASALAAVAASLSISPEIRLEGAMLEAGLAAQRGAIIAQGLLAKATSKLNTTTPQPTLLEPMRELRSAIFGTTIDGKPGTPVLSPFGMVRVLGLQTPTAVLDGGTYYLVVAAPTLKSVSVTLCLPPGVELAADQNVVRITVQHTEATVTTFLVVPKAIGACRLKLSPAPVPPPSAPDLPMYSEPRL